MPNTFKNAMVPSVGTSNTTCYTAPSGSQTTLIGLSIANRSNVDISIDASMRDFSNSNSETFIIVGAPIPVGSALIVIGGDQKVVMESGDTLNVRSSVASSADVIASMLEIT
jgi:hypothetical protein